MRVICVALLLIVSSASCSSPYASQEKSIGRAISHILRNCERQPKLTIEWDTFTEEEIGNIEGMCVEPLASLGHFCTFEPGKRALQENIEEIVCAGGAKRSISTEDGQLQWTVSSKRKKNTDFVEKYLKNDAPWYPPTVRTEQAIARELKYEMRGCDFLPKVTVNWDTFTPEQIPFAKRLCAESFGVLSLCTREPGRTIVRENMKEIVCSAGAEPSISTKDGKLTWVGPIGEDHEDFVMKYLLDEAPWNSPISLRKRIDVAETALCVGDDDRFAGFLGGQKMFYGTGSNYSIMPRTRSGTFFDPREYQPKADPGMRYASGLQINISTNICELRCGTRKIELKLADQETREQRLLTATSTPALQHRRPYALARDRKDRYYFVDTGPEPDSKWFRIFVGKKGALKELKMKNVVSDSGGEVFITETGNLRYVIEKKKSFWIDGGREQELIHLPIDENHHVIWNQLGLYTGDAFGTPCDIF